MKRTILKTKNNAINKFALLVAFLFCSIVMPALSFGQSVFYYNGMYNGVADTAAWGTNPDGTGANPVNFKAAGKTFYFSGVNGTSTVTVPKTWGVTGAGSKVVVTNGVSLTLDSLSARTIFDVDSASTLIIQNTTNDSLGTLHPASTVAYDGPNLLTFLNGNYGNLSSTNDAAGRRTLLKGGVYGLAGAFNVGLCPTYKDSSTFTFNGTKPQIIPTHKFYNLIIANPDTVRTSNTFPNIKSGGSLTINAGSTLIVNSNDTLSYNSKVAPTLNGTFEVSTNGNFSISGSLTSVPAGIVWDSASNLNIGIGSTSLKTLPRLTTDTFQNVIINAPSVVYANKAALLPNTAGEYYIGGDLTIVAGRVNQSGAGTKIKSLTVGGNLNIQGGTYTISDSSKRTSPDSLIVQGNINITGGALYLTYDTATQKGRGALLVAGDLIHSGGSFGNQPNSLTKGYINFNCPDTAGQTLSSIGFTEGSKPGLIRMEVSGGNEVEVASDITANDTLLLTLGYFTVTAGNTLTVNKGTIGYNDTTYIITDATVDSTSKGAVRFNNIPKNVWTTLPVGNDSTFQPLSVMSTDDSTSFTVTTFNGVTKDGNTLGGAITDANTLSNMVFSTWQIARNDKGTSPVSTIFNWDSIMAGSTFHSLANNQITVFQNSGTGFKPITTTSFNDPYDSAVVTLSTFGNFVVASASAPLPVHFVNIQANKVNNYVAINWKTANESNEQNYQVERSDDGINFSTIATLSALNKSTNDYSFNDYNFVKGINYYRIKALGKDGQVSYSSIVKVNVTNRFEASVNVYPNPTINKTFNVALNNLVTDNYTIQVTNSLGQLIFNKQINYTGGNCINSIELNNKLANGLCFVKVSSKDQSFVSTVLIK